MLPPPSPYRVPVRPAATAPSETVDPLASARRAANRFMFGWALLRVGVCAVKGLGFEGLVALVIVVTAVSSLARSLS